MMAARAFILPLALATASAGLAQVRPEPGVGDPRLQSIDYKADQVVLIESAPGYQVTIELAPDEQVETAAVGDASSFQVSINHAGNHLFVKPLQANVATNLTVVTSVRSYAFDLSAIGGPSASTPYTVRFRYAPTTRKVVASTTTTPVEPGRYRVSGTRVLRPSRIGDDGIHTYIAWPPDALLPATYVIDPTGREMLANGAMRGSFYVLDSVAQHLLFRIDKQVARADRVPAGKARR